MSVRTYIAPWLQVELPSPIAIVNYKILSIGNGNDNEGAPDTFALLASNNGSTWQQIDYQSLNNVITFYYNQYVTFTTTNTIAYKYYRLVIISTRSVNSGYYGGNMAIYGFFVGDGVSDYPPYLTSSTDQGYVLSLSNAIWGSWTEDPTNSWYTATQNRPGMPSSYTRQIYISNNGYQQNGSWNPTFRGVPSTTDYFRPPGPPDAPTSLSAVSGNQSITISFTPGSDGDSAITKYQYSTNNGSSYTDCDPPVTISPITISSLTNGQLYSIKIRAVNNLGNGTQSNTITATPHNVPDAPTNLVASYNGSGSVSIAFTPGSDGGLTISNYQYSLDCGVTFVPLNPVDEISPIIISGLTNGQTYCIELKAVNSAAGIASSSVEYTASGPPTTPVIVSTSDLYNGRISVTATVDDQGSPFTNFSYSLNGGTSFTDFNPPQTSVPLTISGLADRVNYNLVIKATNANGTTSSSNTLPLYYRCFLEGTKILCYDPVLNQEVERPVESLRTGDLVKTTMDGYKAIDTIGTNKIYNPANSMRSKNRLYKCSKENYPELNEDLVITGCHAVLVSDLSDEERRALIDIQGKVYVTEDYYRLIACVDKRAQPYEKEGLFNIWHFALENDNYYFNYGIYANGLKVETASKRMMKEMSGMDLL